MATKNQTPPVNPIRTPTQTAVHEPAQTDATTSLPNRSYFYSWLAHALAAPQSATRSIAVLLINIDHFKSLNDTYGRGIGDAILRKTSERLTRTAQAQDMVSRLGNDEFGCALIGTPLLEDWHATATRLRASVSAPMTIGFIEFTVRVSVGIAISPHDGTDANSLMRYAAGAMHRAKLGRNALAAFESRIAPQGGDG